MVCITELTQIAEREIVIYGAGRYGFGWKRAF